MSELSLVKKGGGTAKLGDILSSGNYSLAVCNGTSSSNRYGFAAYKIGSEQTGFALVKTAGYNNAYSYVFKIDFTACTVELVQTNNPNASIGLLSSSLYNVYSSWAFIGLGTGSMETSGYGGVYICDN